MKMVHTKPTDEKFKQLGYPKEPTSFKKIMQSINHHYKTQYALHKKIKFLKDLSTKRYLRIVALKKQLTRISNERNEIKEKFNIVWNKEKKGFRKGVVGTPTKR